MKPIWMRSVWGSLALAAGLGLPSFTFAQDCCPGEKLERGVMGPTLEIADDEEQEMKELEARLNEILIVDESGAIVLREEFKGSLPFPPERVEQMLSAFVEMGEDGKIRIKNKDMVRPYLPMMRRFLSQGGMDKLKDLQKLPPEERRKAMQRLMGEAQGEGEKKDDEKKGAPEKSAPKRAERPARPNRPARPERARPDRTERRRVERRTERRNDGGHSDQVHGDVLRRLEQIEGRLRRIEGYLQRMERAHSQLERARPQPNNDWNPRDRGDERNWGRRNQRNNERNWGRRDQRNDERNWGRRNQRNDERNWGRRNQRDDRGRGQGLNPERMRDLMERFGGERGMRDLFERFGRGMDPEQLRDLMERFGGGRNGFDPEQLRDMFERFGGGRDGFDPEQFRDMFERFGRDMPERFRRQMEEGRRGMERRRGERREGGRRMRDMVQEGGESLRNMHRGMDKLFSMMEQGDREVMRKALGNLAKDFDPQSLQNPDQMLEKLSGNLSPEEMSRLMEIFSEFSATEEGRALQEEFEKMVEKMEGMSESEQGERMLGLLREFESRLGGKGEKFGDRLEGLLRGRNKGTRPAPRRESREGGEKPSYGQQHPKNPKARLY